MAEETLAELVETGLFVDLYRVGLNAVQVGVESYGLKPLEAVTGYRRGHDIDQGSAAVVEYEQYMKEGDPTLLDRIAAYNEDDVRSTLALREWLVDQRPLGLAWRSARFELEDRTPDLDAQVASLHAAGPDTLEHLLGDLLGYWQREWRAQAAPKLAKALGDSATLLGDPEVLTGLEWVGSVDRVSSTGRTLLPAMRFRWPVQEIGPDSSLDRWEKILYATPDGVPGFAGVDVIDPVRREIDLTWNARAQELGVVPTTIMLDDWFSPRPKPEALAELATKLLDPVTMGPPNPVSTALLRRDLPRFLPEMGPGSGGFTDEVISITRWAPELDGSYVAIQGPPGTGKTFRGAHIVLSLILAGKRVGITAMSHPAIDNLLSEVMKLFREERVLDRLSSVRRATEPEDGGLPGVQYSRTNKPCARSEFNLVAGTTWLFAGNDIRTRLSMS